MLDGLAEAVTEVKIVPTVTEAVAVAVQPFASVPVTVYVVEEIGEAFTDTPVVAFRPAPGAQE
jgi:hypothetical protein